MWGGIQQSYGDQTDKNTAGTADDTPQEETPKTAEAKAPARWDAAHARAHPVPAVPSIPASPWRRVDTRPRSVLWPTGSRLAGLFARRQDGVPAPPRAPAGRLCYAHGLSCQVGRQVTHVGGTAMAMAMTRSGPGLPQRFVSGEAYFSSLTFAKVRFNFKTG